MISDNPDLGAIIQAHIRAALANVYVCQPAVLVAFDPNTQRGTFNLAIASFVSNRVTGETVYDEEPTQVFDVPVLAFGSLTGGLLWNPPVVGETALLFFCDRSTIEVKAGTGTIAQPLDVGAMHDVMDAFAIITPNLSAPYQDVVRATIASTGPVLYAPTGKVVNLSHPSPSHFAALADVVMDNLNELRTKVNSLEVVFEGHKHEFTNGAVGSTGLTQATASTMTRVSTMTNVASSKVKLN